MCATFVALSLLLTLLVFCRHLLEKRKWQIFWWRIFLTFCVGHSTSICGGWCHLGLGMSCTEPKKFSGKLRNSRTGWLFTFDSSRLHTPMIIYFWQQTTYTYFIYIKVTNYLSNYSITLNCFKLMPHCHSKGNASVAIYKHEIYLCIRKNKILLKLIP